MSNQRLADDFVIQVELQLAVLDQVQKERGYIARVHLAGMIWNTAGQVNGADDGYSVLDHGFASSREFTVSATLGGQIEDDRTGRHFQNHLPGNQDR